MFTKIISISIMNDSPCISLSEYWLSLFMWTWAWGTDTRVRGRSDSFLGTWHGCRCHWSWPYLTVKHHHQMPFWNWKARSSCVCSDYSEKIIEFLSLEHHNCLVSKGFQHSTFKMRGDCWRKDCSTVRTKCAVWIAKKKWLQLQYSPLVNHFCGGYSSK